MVKHDKINGEDYKKLIINAAQCLENNKEEINELNVFPVPDGDTGSNMSMTISHAAEELIKSAEMSLGAAADKTAKAMLHGARGNSGVITSLLFRGIAKGLASVSECDGKGWATALKYGVESAYNAVDAPAEGTILTVARRSAERAEVASKEKNDFSYVLKETIKAAEIALNETIKQNPVLEKAGVVDAGGKGWLIVMQAMLNALEGKDVVSFNIAPKSSPNKKADFTEFATEDIKFAFCTEFIVRKNDGEQDTKDFKSYLNSIGDSLVMIDDGEIIKVHVHTNEPYEVIGKAKEYGVYETVKIENMRTQHTNKIVDVAEPESKEHSKQYGFVSVSNGEGINDIFKELGVDEIVSGGQTMNPSTEQLIEAIKTVNAKTVFVLPNNKNIIMTAEQAALLVKDKEVVIIPTKTIPQGFSALLAYNEEGSTEENEAGMKEAISQVDTMQVTYAVKNSDFDGLNISEGDYLAIYENKLICVDKSRETIIKNLAKQVKEKEKTFVSIYYGSDISEEEAKKALEIFQTELEDMGAEINLYEGKQPVYYYIISAE